MKMVTCRACGDVVPVHPATCRVVNKLTYCRECGDELAEGAVGPPPKSLFFGGHNREHLYEDNSGPGQDNAIRELEDG